MNRLLVSILLGIICFTSSSVFAKGPDGPLVDKVITGKITDDQSNAPLIGASVFGKGTNVGTSTDDKGNFSITVPDNTSVLVISFAGYTQKEVDITSSNLSIKMTRVTASLDEVIVIGYGSQKKKEVTASIASVKSENFVKGAVNDAGQLIQGKVAGLSIATPGGDPTANSQIILRGINSINASSSPLILIDGIPGDLRTISPENIESIDVLKDGSAAAIYGTRGTNGVILITSRKSNGRISSVEYSSYVSTQTIVKKPPMLTAAEYRQQIAGGATLSDLGASTDWIKEITRTPISHVHNLTFRGGNPQTNYLVDLNYRSFQGIMLKSDNKAFNVRFDVNHSMFNGLLKANINMINTSQDYTTTGDGYSFNGFAYRQALIRNPTSPIKDSAGNWFEQTGIFQYENPLSRIYESDGKNTNQSTRVAGSLTLTPFSGLVISALGARTKFNEARGYSETKKHISTIRDSRNGYASRGFNERLQNLLEITATYSKVVGSHSFTVLGGYSYQDNTYADSYMTNWDFPTDLFTYNNIGIGDAAKRGINAIASTRTKTNLIGFFGRATYNYKEKYLLMASVRREATSTLVGAKQPWGTFPAVSVGWRLNKEGFLKNVTAINDLKLRVGYGVTGTPPQSLFLGVARLGYSGYTLSNGAWVPQLVPVSNPNPDLRWEQKEEANIGLDFSLYNGRVNGSFDAYSRRVNGLLYEFPVPTPPNLFNTTWANVGVMKNTGFEAIINFTPVTSKDFEWSSSVNFSTNNNKLVSLSNDNYKTTTPYFNTGYTGDPIQTYTHRVEVGRAIGEFYGYKVVDVDENGKWIFEGEDGKPVSYDDFKASDEDKRVLGNGLPKYYAGWNNNLRYKIIDLSVTMRGAFDYQILNFQRMYYENTGRTQYNQLKSAYDPLFGKTVMDKNVPLQFNSYYIENGDFWKIDNITLGCNIGKIGNIAKNTRVYISMLNSLVITGYKGIDPEVNRLGLAPGDDDRDKYPSVRTFTLGLNTTF